MFGQAPNTGFGASTGGFGTNTNAPFGAAKPAGGAFNFGTTTSAAPPSFGATAPAFGAPASSATPSFGGGFSAPANSATSFGFGTSTSTAPPAFGSSFGTVASSAAPTFGGGTFGSTSTAPFGASTGTTAFGASTGGAFGAGNTFGTTGSTFGGGGTFGGGSAFGGGGSSFMNSQQQQLQQQQLQQQQPPNVTEQLLSSIMRVSMFNDDRDNILARWNLLQASWGVGKAYYANNQQPLALNNENPMCRFKAIGYSAIPKDNKDIDLLAIVIKKKSNEIEALKPQLINDLKAALGNKPNINVVIEEVQAFSGDNSQIIFHVVEANMTGQTRKINANDVYNALNQGNTWPTLQQRHSLESLAPKVAFVKDQLEEYLKNSPNGVDPKLWKQSQLDNPNSDRFLPVPLVGFKALQTRIKRQDHQAKIFQGRLDDIAKDIAESQKRQQDNSAKLRDAKRKQLELSHRVLNIITRQEMTRKLGFTIQLEEEKLRIQLEALQSTISAPTQFKGRLNELLSQVRLQSQSNVSSSDQASGMDPFALDDIKLLLKQQQDGIQSLMSTMKQDLNALETMNEKLSKKNANSSGK